MRHRSVRLCVIILVVLTSLLMAHGAGAQEPPRTTHVVQTGENLYRIGLMYGFTADELALANGITDQGQIYAGQVLVIPVPVGGGEELNTPPASHDVAAAAPTDTGSTTHIVQVNEDLASIARRYGVAWTDIVRANNIANPDLIFVGQTLVIPAPGAPPAVEFAPPSPAASGRIIVVSLNTQYIRAYENGQLMREVRVSTGLPGTPTVQGDFAIYVKLPEQTMYGPGYYLPGVPYVMYFYQGYAIHGTYWHNNFGTPMSHGCVNLPTSEAAWFFEFAEMGTVVRVEP